MLFFVLVMLSVCMVYAGMGEVDSDWVWQAANGKSIVESWDFDGFKSLFWGDIGLGEYIDHEWGSSVLMHVFSQIPFGMVLYRFSIYFGVIFVCYKLYRLYAGKPCFTHTMLMCLCLGTDLYLMRGKVSALSVLYFALELYILLRFKQDTEWRGVLFLPILSIIWINTHGGSANLFLAVGVMFVACNMFSFRLGRLVSTKFDTRDTLRLIIIGSLSYSLQLCNPFGIKLLQFNISHFGNQAMKEMIMEWHAIDLGSVLGRIVAIPIAVGVLVLFSRMGDIDLFDFTLLGSMSVLAFTSQRHAMFMFPIVTIVIAKHMRVDDVVPRKSLWVVLAAVVFASTVYSFGGKIDTSYRLDGSLQVTLPRECLSALRDSGKSNLYNSFEYGGYLNQVGVQCFVNGIYPYCEERVLDGVAFEFSSSDFEIERIIKKYSLDSFLINTMDDVCGYVKYSSLYCYLKTHEAYECVYEDGYTAYFITKGDSYD